MVAMAGSNLPTGSQPTSPHASHSRAAGAVLQWAQLLSPVVLLAGFIVATALHGVLTSRREEDLVVPVAKGPGGRPLPATRVTRRPVPERLFGPASRLAFQIASALVVLSFVANAANVIVHAITTVDSSHSWWCGEEAFVYIVGCCSFYSYILLTLFDWADSPTVVHLIVWILSLATETVVFGALVAWVSGPHTVLQNVSNNLAAEVPGPTPWDAIDVTIGASRLVVVIGIVLLYVAVACRRPRCLGEKRRNTDRGRSGGEGGDANERTTNENTPLLARDRGRDCPSYTSVNGNGNGYNGNGHNGNGYAGNGHAANGSANGNVNSTAAVPGAGAGETGGQLREANAAFYRPEKLPHKTWWEYMRGYSLFAPYLWPRDSLRLQVIVLFCFALLVLQRYVNILVPDQTGRLASRLEETIRLGENRVPWPDLGLLILAKVLQGPSGLLGSLRAVLWIPVSQYSYRALASAAFEHVHSLSLDFHLSKRTGEVLSALSKGAKINEFLEQVTFQVFPTLVDLLVAIVYFQIMFGSVYSVCVTVMTFAYLFLTIRMAASRSDERRDMTNAGREEDAVKNDSIVSYETVKYFNAEQFEFQRYRKAIGAFQKAEGKVVRGVTNMNVCQNLVFMCGMLMLLMISSYDVVTHKRKVGDFMTVVMYLGQLQGPLNFFGTFYRQMQQAMISGERMLELFKITPTVVDRRTSPPLLPLPSPLRGHIRWSRVRFWYNDRDHRRPALHDLSFECRPGTTTAFVGESGGGKSTVFRLMFRYYNCNDGAIEVDGHNVQDVTIDSVRRAIGVVPQETILFNETVMYNLRYANQAATDEEVYEACRAASIHDRILSFPDGYNTMVGERGQCLSGGEKQRVAIARLLLKNPKIIMLDEATSALDSETEQQIQAKLIKGDSLGQDRTLLIIAHRLSTITHADQIIVLHAGSIIEKGTHMELLELGGKYASMWEKQSKAEEAALKARDATARANKLLRQAQLGGDKAAVADSSDDSDGYNSMSSSSVLPRSSPPSEAPHSEDSSSDDDIRNQKKNKTRS